MELFIKLYVPLLCILSLFSHQTMSQPQYLTTFCNNLSDNFTQNSTYKSNRDTLLSSLRDQSSLGTYSNVTIGVTPDTVYGMFLCSGATTKTSCSDCVQTASLEIVKNNCTYQKNAIIYYEECMVRYSNVSFFGLVEDGPYTAKYSLATFPNSLFINFQDTLSKKVEELIVLTGSNYSASKTTPYYVRDVSRAYTLEGSYTLDTVVQCSPDLSPGNCGECLRLVVQGSLICCKDSRLAKIFNTKCYLKYDTTGSAPPSDGSSSINVMKGKEIFGKFFIIAITTLVLVLVGL